ncbi:alpha/beta hydrolase [Leucobacter tardus]|uniref:Alpha/beta fold hydrolase n=1 Tax=Leucobacter tardus TaxID=501483 RepID=A0A939QB29_9MICO|nr:alpha/beta hydrolase [Leucobacter tardus]MBO2988955.1 alpha/beta fold hydrolase [Leucobacter tardus]
MTDDETPRRRGPRAVIVTVAILVVVALGVYGILPLFIGSRAATDPEPGPLPEAPAASVEAFGAQEPEWWDCADGTQCADVYAPIDWADPAGDRITLRLVKQPATGGEAVGTLFVNPGGPGASGAGFVAGGVDGSVTQQVQAAYDIVGWDPRGVGASTPVDCYDDAQMDDYLFGDDEAENLEPGSDEWIAAAVDESTKFGEACAAETGPLIAHVGTDETVRDLDMLRAIFGEDTLDYIGYSYGTMIGARYADAYPERVGRLVLDGAMDPDTSEFDVVREQTRGFEAALRAYVADCLERDGCPLTGNVDTAMSQIGDLLQRVDAEPVTGDDGRIVTVNTLLTAIITPLYSPDSWSALDDLFSTVSAGDAQVALGLADFYFNREDGQYTDNQTEAFSAINCADYGSDFDAERMREQADELARIAPTIGPYQGYGEVSCARWPSAGESQRSAVSGAGAAPILVVGTTGDPATPYRWAESLAEQLESGVLVTYEGEGHTAYGENACVDETVDAYLLEGTVPATDPRCA